VSVRARYPSAHHVESDDWSTSLLPAGQRESNDSSRRSRHCNREKSLSALRERRRLAVDSRMLFKPENPPTSVKPPSDRMNSTEVVRSASSLDVVSFKLVSRKLGSKPEKKPSMYESRTGVKYASTVQDVPRATIRIMGREAEDSERCVNPRELAISAICFS
jgi:hypothetical protein